MKYNFTFVLNITINYFKYIINQSISKKKEVIEIIFFLLNGQIIFIYSYTFLSLNQINYMVKKNKCFQILNFIIIQFLLMKHSKS